MSSEEVMAGMNHLDLKVVFKDWDCEETVTARLFAPSRCVLTVLLVSRNVMYGWMNRWMEGQSNNGKIAKQTLFNRNGLNIMV